MSDPVSTIDQRTGRQLGDRHWDLNLAAYQERFVPRLQELQRRARRLGVEPLRTTEIERYNLPVESDSGLAEVERRVIVRLDGQSPRLPGTWRFVAQLAHTPSGPIVRAPAGQTLPERYRTAAPACEHCHRDVARTTTYVVVDTATGQHLQVGSDCLKSYLGGWGSPVDAAAWWDLHESFATLGEFDPEDLAGVAAAARLIRLDSYLRLVAILADMDGFRSRTTAGDASTADRAANLYYDLTGRDPSRREQARRLLREDPERADRAMKLATAARAWVRTLPAASDWEHNVQVLDRNDAITARDFGYAASIIGTYMRRGVIARPTSGWLGQPGERQRVQQATVLDSRVFRGYRNKRTTLLKLATTDDHLLVCRTTAQRLAGLQPGDVVDLDVEITAHEIWVQGFGWRFRPDGVYTVGTVSIRADITREGLLEAGGIEQTIIKAKLLLHNPAASSSAADPTLK